MDIAVIGASGDVGRQVAQQVVVTRQLDRSERLVLVGNREGKSARSTYGLAADLRDAYSDIAPGIKVSLDASEIRADLIIVAAGMTPTPSPGASPLNRDALAESNAAIFHSYANAIAKHGHGHEIVICVSNPVELSVAIFAQALGRTRVMGMGAFLDSLRFREEIASSLGLNRKQVHAFIAGEHGSLAVPLWSDVHIYGLTEVETEVALNRIRNGVQLRTLWEEVAKAQAELRSLIADGRVEDAYAVVDRYPPDVRVVTRPFVTHYSGAKTVVGTARATMKFIRTITQGADALVSGQVALNGNAYGIRGTIGVPFVVGNRGVDRVFELPIEDDERRWLSEAARLCNEKISRFL